MRPKVIYEDNHVIVIEKPVNIPVQRDESNDLDMLTIVKTYLKEKYNKPGNVYLGMVHRLDRPVGGVMVFAKTSKAASRLSEIIRTNKFGKKYYAVIHGKLSKEVDVLEDYLLKDTETNTSKVVDEMTSGAKKAILSYEVIKYDAIRNLSLVEVDLKTGRHHQIRVQFMAIGHPVLGDQRYGNLKEKGVQIHLWSYSISFEHPVKKEVMSFSCKPGWFPLHN